MDKVNNVIDDDIERRLLEMMEQHPEKLIPYFLIISGRIMLEARAGVFKNSVHATLDGKRYKISASFKLKELFNNTENNG